MSFITSFARHFGVHITCNVNKAFTVRSRKERCVTSINQAIALSRFCMPSNVSLSWRNYSTVTWTKLFLFNPVNTRTVLRFKTRAQFLFYCISLKIWLIFRMANGLGSSVYQLQCPGLQQWALCLALKSSFLYSWIISKSQGKKQVLYHSQVILKKPEKYLTLEVRVPGRIEVYLPCRVRLEIRCTVSLRRNA